ncbi:MAG: sugar phosphate isomerase/epimerase family protein [Acutalibacteraceae bacterium]
MIREYCKIGINHHLLFPGVLDDPHYHERSLYALLIDGYFDIIDMSLPDDAAVRMEEIKMLKSFGKTIIYNFPLFCLSSNEFDLNSLSKKVRERTLGEAKKHLEYAAAAGAKTVTFASGVYRFDMPEEEQLKGFIEYSVAFNEAAKALGITALLEPFDRSIGKNLLLGKVDLCVAYIEALRSAGCENIALMQDMAHIPLIGEDFAYTLQKSKPYLFHIHLGNCVMRDPKNPYYGDTHPPIGIDGGENDMDELIEFTRALKDIGYLYKGGHNSVTFEMQPYPGASSLTSAKLAAEKFETALNNVYNQK